MTPVRLLALIFLVTTLSAQPLDQIEREMREQAQADRRASFDQNFDQIYRLSAKETFTASYLIPNQPPVFLSPYNSCACTTGPQPSRPINYETLNVDKKTNIPQLLATDTTEPFYAPLSYLLRNMVLRKKLKLRLTTYLQQRQKLLEKFSSATLLNDEDLAALQSSETEAEAIRSECVAQIAGAIHAPPTNPYDKYESSPSSLQEAMFLLRIAYYQEGIDPPHRALLQRLADKLNAKASEEKKLQSKTIKPLTPDKNSNDDETSDSTDATATEAPSPSTRATSTLLPLPAHFEIPSDASPELLAKLQSLETQADALAEALRKTAHDQAGTFLDKNRVKAFRALAEQQAPAFAQLEILAEEIRRDLAPLLAAHPVVCPAQLSAELFSRIQAHHSAQLSFDHDVDEKLRALRTAFPDVKFWIKKTKTSFNLIKKSPEKFKKTTGYKKLTADLKAQNETLNAHHQAIAAERASLKKETETLGHPQLFDDLLHQLAQQHRWPRYRLYYEAAFKPGVSSAQRRLLFGHALAELQP